MVFPSKESRGRGMEALESDQSVSQDEDGCEDQASKRIKTEPDNDDSLIGLTSIPDHGSAAILTPSSGGALVRLLQGVSTSNGTGLPENVQIIALADSSDSNENVAQWQVLPAGGEGDVPQFFATCVGKADDASGEKGVGGGGDVVGRQDLLSSVVWPQEVLPVQPMPAGSPEWATRMRDCEKIGDSYRGWVASEQELDLLLTYHKQQTGSMWGTRQSPSPARASSRLMWKSQYVPFDGMPFLNAGSRAVVMECQYGPRRKGKDPTLKKPIVDTMKTIYKQTCPARIYVKKVRKYPQFKVNMELSKRNMRAEMDRIFQEMKQLGPELPHVPGEERWYAQLPTNKTHEFHKELASEAARPGGGSREPVSGFSTHRVDAAVVVKLREFVSYGETRVYAIRKRLRQYVEHELFGKPSDVPQKHNASYFPTVHDIQNHVHEALKDISNGTLPLLSQTITMEVYPGTTGGDEASAAAAAEQRADEGRLPWQQEADTQPHPETVTVTLTQASGQGGHYISKVETLMSDGTLQVSTSLSEETAQLLARLPVFAAPEGLVQQQQKASPPQSAVMVENAEADATAAALHVIEVDPATSDPAATSDVASPGEGVGGACISRVLVDAACGSHDDDDGHDDGDASVQRPLACEAVDMSVNAQLLAEDGDEEHVAAVTDDDVVEEMGVAAVTDDDVVEEMGVAAVTADDGVEMAVAAVTDDGIVVQNGVSIVTYTLSPSIVMGIEENS